LDFEVRFEYLHVRYSIRNPFSCHFINNRVLAQQEQQ